MTDETEAVIVARGWAYAFALHYGDPKDAGRALNEGDIDCAQAAITTLDRHRIERAGDVERYEIAHIYGEEWQNPNGEWVRYAQASALIATLRAEIERLTERADQAKLDGVRAGIEASAERLRVSPFYSSPDSQRRACFSIARDIIRALSAEAIAKGEA